MEWIVKIVSNGSKPDGGVPDSVDSLIDRLWRLTLAPESVRRFEGFGQMTVTFHGNFTEESAVFDVRVREGSRAFETIDGLFRKQAENLLRKTFVDCEKFRRVDWSVANGWKTSKVFGINVAMRKTSAGEFLYSIM